jgi:hypothetical protein
LPVTIRKVRHVVAANNYNTMMVKFYFTEMTKRKKGICGVVTEVSYGLWSRMTTVAMTMTVTMTMATLVPVMAVTIISHSICLFV